MDRPFVDKTPMDIPRLLGLLHMSLKYHYHVVFENLVNRVQVCFPSDVTEIDDARHSTALRLEPGDEFDLIRVAGGFGLSSSLPAIFYRVVERYSQVHVYIYHGVSLILFLAPDSSRRSTAGWIPCTLGSTGSGKVHRG
ncbi:hypothetical protein DXG01_005133 [Tephrocybe rancida]|nr:hypothetical protein DXG01_005133 [Tephrocybe rancida]